MKFTKQEQSLIKIAAAHMASHMVKKATLQDKLAEYGIGLTKQAAEPPAPLKVDPKKTIKETMDDIHAIETERLNQDWRQKRETAPNETQALIGEPIPRDAKNDRVSYGFSYPYAKARYEAAVKTNGEEVPHRSKIPENDIPTSAGISSVPAIRLFDTALDKAMKAEQKRTGSLWGLGLNRPTQQQATNARWHQAKTLADYLFGYDGTPEAEYRHNDAVNMLIQAGKNNLQSFEDTDKVPVYEPGQVPAGYTGRNTLTPEQMEKLYKFFPTMGATGNFRRFSNLS